MLLWRLNKPHIFEAVIGADITQFRRGMRDVRNELGILSETTSSGLQSIARTATYTISVPLAIAGAAAVKTAAEFDSSMRNINSIMHFTGSELDALGQKVLDLGSNSRYGANAAGEALYDIFSAGVSDATAATDLLAQSIAVAEAGQADLASTTRGMTAVMLAYASTGLTVEQQANATTRAIAVGVGSQEDYNQNIQKTLPLARALNIGYEDLAASIAVVSQNGSGLSKAETSIAMAMSNLLKPTEAMQAAFKNLGVSTGAELITKFGGVTEAIYALRSSTESPIDFAKMFSKTGLEAAYTLTNDIDVTRQKLTEFYNGLDTAVVDARAEQLKSFSAQWDIMQAAIEGAAITIGQVLLPVLIPIVQGIADFFNGLRELNPEVLELGVVVAGAVAAAAPLVWLITSLASPVGLLIGAFAGLAAAVAQNWDAIKVKIEEVITSVFGNIENFESAINGIKAIVFPEPVVPETSPADILTGWADEIRSHKIEITTSDIIEVKEGDSLWSIWAESYKDDMSFDEFVNSLDLSGFSTAMNTKVKDELSGNPVQITAEDLISVDSSNPDLLVQAVNSLMLGANPEIRNTINTNSIVIRPGDIIRFKDDMGVGGADSIGNKMLDWLARGVDNFAGKLDTVPVVEVSAQTTFLKPLTDMLQSLSDLAEDLGSSKIGEALGNIWEGIKGFIEPLAGADWSGVAKLFAIFGGGLLIALFEGIEAVGKVVQAVLPPLGEAVAGFVNILAGIGNLDAEQIAAGFGQMLGGIGEAIMKFGTEIILFPLEVVGAVFDAIENITGIDLPDLSGWAEDLKAEVAAMFEPAPDTEAALWVNQFMSPMMRELSMFTPEGDMTLDMSKMQIMADAQGMDVSQLKAILLAQLLTALPTAPDEYRDDIAAMISTLTGTVATELDNAQLPEGSFNIMDWLTISTGGELDTSTIGTTLFDRVKSALTSVFATEPSDDQKVPINPMNMLKLLSDEGIATGDGTSLVKTEDIVPTPAEMQTAMTGMQQPFDDAFTNMVETVGSLDPEQVNTQYLIPMQDAFVATFGEGSPARTAVLDFFTQVGTASMLGSAQLITYGVQTIATGATMITTWTLAVSAVTAVLQKWNDKLQEATRMVQTLRAEAAKPISIRVSYDFLGMGDGNPGQGTLGVDGSHAGGLERVPFDGYIAELHKDERVLTADENAALMDSQKYSGQELSNINSNNTSQSNTVNVYGVENVDQLLSELERRGIKL